MLIMDSYFSVSDLMVFTSVKFLKEFVDVYDET